MATMHMTARLAREYHRLFRDLEITPDRLALVDRDVDGALDHKTAYQEVASQVSAPWYFVAAIHTLECGRRFDCHLHNGDPLTERTHRVPEGYPRTGEPPFAWEESAADALRLRKIDQVDDWSLERLLYELEGYNGWGYRLYHSHVKSPYLWSFSNHYRTGKYVADGSWSESAVSGQCGAAVLIKRLEQREEISTLTPGNLSATVPMRFSSQKIELADDLQRFLNTFPGNALHVDGIPGRRTSDAVKRTFGFYLEGDPKA